MPKGAPNKQHSGEFKQMAIEDMRTNRLSQHEAARSLSMVQRYDRIYLEDGAQGLYIERRGRASSASGTLKGRPPKLDKTVEEDIKCRNC